MLPGQFGRLPNRHLHLKLYQQMYAPLTSAICDPVPADNQVLTNRQTRLDRLYVAVDKAVQNSRRILAWRHNPCVSECFAESVRRIHTLAHIGSITRACEVH